ncbi:MAG: M20/M25/M40 family metallo-hydrolase [Acidimicrobiia bacterium]|nr:M20/M25/M40 family metallo-hydrolase [Acidimicrobiia bacterium]
MEDLPSTPPAIAAARRWTSLRGSDILGEFGELVSIANVSSDRAGVEATADRVQRMLERRGVPTRTLTTPGGAPIVSGRIEVADDVPTIGIYAHYDGQPVDERQWRTPPFTASLFAGDEELRLPASGEVIDPEWRLFGRSTADDKAPIQALVSALDALASDSIAPTVNVVLLFEGEEEIGSPNLASYLRDHDEWFAADMWLICDGPVHQSSLPQIIFGARGIAQIDITVYGPTRPLHSGHYGNWVPSPTWDLVQLLASMRAPDGSVLIDGFYDDVVEPSPSERAAIAAVPDYERGLLDELGVASAEGDGETLIERMYRPSLNIRGLSGGPVGDAAANVLPESATVSIDVRLPAHHDPHVVLGRIVRHIERQGFVVVDGEPSQVDRLANGKTASVRLDPHYGGMRVGIDTPEARAVLEAAAAASDTGEVVTMPTLGGSVPIIHFDEILGAPTIIVPMANHDNNQHDANENLRVGNLWYGVRLMAALLTMGYRPG